MKNRLLKDYYELTPEQRLQWKKYLCMLGTAFLLFLLFLGFLLRSGEEETEPEPERPQPSVIVLEPEEMLADFDDIRVLLKTSDYEGIRHSSLILTADCNFVLQYGDGERIQEELFSVGEEVEITPESSYFTGERIRILPSGNGRIHLRNVQRNQEDPAYRGTLELLRTQGGIVVINELPLEEYLCGVVPSEMPAAYPIEALKAQAISARTYACVHILHPGYPQYGAHVDDSTSYQVYNNIPEAETTNAAVAETKGQMLLAEDGAPAEACYYSTSCGAGARADLMSEEAFDTFIRGTDEKDYEAKEAWYRWTYTVAKIDTARMVEVLKKRYETDPGRILTLRDDDYVSQPIKAFSKVRQIAVTKRGENGVAEELLLVTNKGTYRIDSEYNIRMVLCDGETKVIRQDGSEVAMPSLLPSGFFMIEPSNDKKNVVGYNIIGGGFGHGVGMSQNGAKNMALQGQSAEQILNFFYEGYEICSER